MTQGGASGSPVFLPDSGKVIGVLYAGLNEFDNTLDNNDSCKVPTNISYVVPAHLIAKSLQGIEADANFKLPTDAQSLDQIIETSKFVNKFEGSGNVYQVKAAEPPGSAQKLERLNFKFGGGAKVD